MSENGSRWDIDTTLYDDDDLIALWTQPSRWSEVVNGMQWSLDDPRKIRFTHDATREVIDFIVELVREIERLETENILLKDMFFDTSERLGEMI